MVYCRYYIKARGCNRWQGLSCWAISGILIARLPPLATYGDIRYYNGLIIRQRKVTITRNIATRRDDRVVNTVCAHTATVARASVEVLNRLGHGITILIDYVVMDWSCVG